MSERLVVRLRRQALAGSSWNAVLLHRMADEVEAGGDVPRALAPIAHLRSKQAPSLRVLAAAHRLALDGDAPAYAAHCPTTGGDGDAEAAWPAFRDLLVSGALDTGMAQPVQTNEPRRAAALVPAFGHVQAATGLPLRLLELGSSAGLLLRFDRYRYEIGGRPWGDLSSPVCVTADGDPPLRPVDVVDRRGCDPNPLDPVADRSLLLSWIWPDQRERFDAVAAALDLAAANPDAVDPSPGSAWLGSQLATAAAGAATVVFHSIVWQYLPEEEAAAVTAAIEEAGARATADAPLAWLRFEPHDAHPETGVDLRLRLWPGGDDGSLARCGYHGTPIDWRAGP